MGREQKRREAKKHKHKDMTKINNNEGNISFKTTIKLVVIVAAILVVLYLCLAIFITKEMDVLGTKDEETTNTDTTTDSVSNKILASNTFRQSEETYYVYYYDFDEEEDAIKSSISNLTDYTIYRVDTGSSLNTNYVSEESNKDAKSLEELKVTDPTLIKVENDTIKEYYEGVNSITDYINNK